MLEFNGFFVSKHVFSVIATHTVTKITSFMWILDRGMLEFRTKTVILPRLQKATTANITLISMFLGDRHDGKYSMIQHS